MRRASVPRTAVAALAVAALAVAGCSSKSADSGTAGADADGVRTGDGVTDKVIPIGALTDMTGVYASLGKSVTQAQQLFVEQINEEGGVCGRDLELTVRDHGYDAGKAIPAYTELEPEVLGFVQFIGSPFVSAAKSRIEQDQVVVMPQAWAASLLGSDYIRMVGATYDVETVNAIDFLKEEKGLADGATLGHVYFEGDYGENALQGSEHMAQEAGLEVVEQKIKPTDEDMSAQVAAFKREGVDAIMISAGPAQAASLVGVAAAGGLDVPIIGNNSTFAPQLLDTQAAPALMANFHVAASTLPIGSEEAAPTKLAEDYRAKFPEDGLDNGVIAGWSAISVYTEALRTACDNRELTREGVADAMKSLGDWANGFGVTHDFSDPAEPSTRESFVLKPDDSVPGGLTVAREGGASEAAEAFTREG